MNFISVFEFAKLLISPEKNNVCIIDIREKNELELCKLNFDLAIPMSEISTRLDEIPDDKKLILYCHHGKRSHILGLKLIEIGFDEEKIFSLIGGIHDFAKEIDPTLAIY